MLTRRAFSSAAVAGLALPGGGCEQMLGYRIRYKSTLTVTAGNRVVVGEGVAETVTRDDAFGGVQSRTRGEAAVADLGAEGVVAALMRGFMRRADGGFVPGYDSWAGWAALAPGSSWEGGRNSAFQKLSQMRRSQPVPLAGPYLPVLGYFPDRLDKRRCILLGPHGSQAPGLPTVSMTVEVTSERLFRNHPERVLPWAGPDAATTPVPQVVWSDAGYEPSGFEPSREDILRPKLL